MKEEAVITEAMSGTFDIIGYIQGCCEELYELLNHLRYKKDRSHPEGRRLAFVGDLTDRGPC